MIPKKRYIFCYRRYLPLIFVFVIRFETTKKRWGWLLLIFLDVRNADIARGQLYDLMQKFWSVFWRHFACFKSSYEGFSLCYSLANIYLFKVNNRNRKNNKNTRKLAIKVNNKNTRTTSLTLVILLTSLNWCRCKKAQS